MVSVGVLMFVVLVAASAWPWQQWCKQSLIDTNNSTACVINERKDLPPVDGGAQYDVYYCLHRLSAGGAASNILSLTHSMLWIRDKSNATGLRFVVEFAAVYFGPKAVMPTILPNGSLSWKADGVLAWLPETNQTQWLSEANKTHIGIIDGISLEKWFAWAVDWRSTRNGYQVWSVWDSSDVFAANRLLNDSICHTFTEDGLVSMYNLGARFYQNQPLCRNYFPYLSSSAPTIVQSQHDQHTVDKYFRQLDQILCLNLSNASQFGDAVRTFLSTTAGRIYIYQWARTERYWEVHLKAPYLSNNLYQPMVLPWQSSGAMNELTCENHDQNGELPLWGSIVV